MPYIAADDRPPLDARVDALAEELSSKLSGEMNGDTEASLCYREAFLAVGERLLHLQGGQKPEARGAAERLAHEVFLGAEKHGYRGAWLGPLEYALTRLIQVVPAKMVAKKAWRDEFRFWTYVQTAGALERAAMSIHAQGGESWVADALVGVLTDVKDEYKRRVNTAYEATQIRKSGDCYTGRYRTELVDVPDDRGGLAGYAEVMKDFGSPSTRKPGGGSLAED